MQMQLGDTVDGVLNLALIGRLVLYGAQPLVAEVLETTSLNDIVPVRADATTATTAARG